MPLGRRAQLQAYLRRLAWGAPDEVRAAYALADRQLFDELFGAGEDAGRARLELLWYYELCALFGWRLNRGGALTWLVHRDNDRCGLCNGALPSSRYEEATLLQRRLVTGWELRLCLQHRIELRQKLRMEKKRA